jgi:hypothetical protein
MTKSLTTPQHLAVMMSVATLQSLCPPVNAKIPLTQTAPACREQGLYRFARNLRRGSGDDRAAYVHMVETRRLA